MYVFMAFPLLEQHSNNASKRALRQKQLPEPRHLICFRDIISSETYHYSPLRCKERRVFVVVGWLFDELHHQLSEIVF